MLLSPQLEHQNVSFSRSGNIHVQKARPTLFDLRQSRSLMQTVLILQVIRDLALVHHDSSSVAMETGKPGLASAPVHINSVAAQTEKGTDIQAPLMAVYIPTMPALPVQPYPQPPAAAREPAALHLAVPPLYSKEMLPFLTLHIAGGLQSQPGLSLAAASPAARPKSSGKHVCPHCGRDCMKPSVLEKHLRCHTGERPYPCTTCGISFKTQSNLYKHKRTQAHARLSSESDQSFPGSLESMSSSRETCTSSLSLDEHNEESGSVDKDTAGDNTAKTCSVKKHGSVGEQNEVMLVDHKTKEQNESVKMTTGGQKPLTTASRHLTLQRQEATLFSKQWESSASRGKSQSHESTDSGFSESSEHYPSPGSILPDHSMDLLTESTKEHLEETTNTQAPPEAGQVGQEPKVMAREQEQKILVERISKLISENSAVVEDKQLENVRPRKTILSKQGSIDLPMPYTYKDSFHFDMKISKTSNVGLQRNRKPAFYSSVPTQQSTTMEHAPLTRSHSLPFSVTLLQPERSSSTSCSQSDYERLVQRGSSGQINPTGFSIKPVNQQSSTHRPLVRQKAVDCNHATDGLYMNSSVEEACTSSLSCDGDGTDICGESSNRKFRRKKTQKFAYNKWYMYGGGTFKKLYNAEKGGDDSVIKGRKCSINPEHEVVQGLQKRLSDVHKEMVATTGSIINTSSSTTQCHSDCSSAKPSAISALDFNLKTTQLHSSSSSLKSPLRRNLSLSILPVPVIGPLVYQKSESMNRAGNGRQINEKTHSDSCSQLRSQIPSDRKKQKTDDKVICPMEMDTELKLTRPPLCFTSTAPQQATTVSFINLQENVKHTQLKGALPPCVITARPQSVSLTGTSLTAPTSSAAKTSFLPKYQLKLPNTVEPEPNPSLNVTDSPTGTTGHNFTPGLLSSAPLSSSIQSCDTKKTNALSSTQGQLLLPCKATTLCQVESSIVTKDTTASQDAVRRQGAVTTITTTCRQDNQAGLCSTSEQPSKYAGCSALMHLPGATGTMVMNLPVTPIITTANDQSTNQTAFSQPSSNPPLPHTQLSPRSDQLSSANRGYPSSNTPLVPAQNVPFDQMQPVAQNVFHVHTADLQICLQIISDEQLALIEPQIERQSGIPLLQGPENEAVAPELIQRTARSCDTMESSSEGRDGEHLRQKKELDKSDSLSTDKMERINPPLSVQVEKAGTNLLLNDPSNSKQATVSTECNLPEALGSLWRPHKYGHVNMTTEALSTMANVVSTSALLKGVKSGRSQTSEEEHAISLKLSTEVQLFPNKSVSQGGLVSQTVYSQHNLSTTSLSTSTENQNSMRREIWEKDSQHKFKNQGATCSVATAKSEASTCESSKFSSGEDFPLQVGLDQASGAACTEEPSDSVPSYSINKYRAPRHLKPQASIYCCNPAESALPETRNSSKYSKVGCDMVSPMDNSASSQEMTLSESQDSIGSSQSEKQLGQFTSASTHIQVGRPKDTPAVFTSTQSTAAGIYVIYVWLLFSNHTVHDLWNIQCF